MNARRFFRIILPIAFLCVAVIAWNQTWKAVGAELGRGVVNDFRQAFLQTPLTAHPLVADAWLCLAIVCFILGIISAWRLFRTKNHEGRA